MSHLILMNDVATDLDDDGLVVGSADPPSSSLGNEQVDRIVPYFYEKIKHVDLVYSSDAQRLLKLVHKLRAESQDNRLAGHDLRKLIGLRERNFGVLNRNPIEWSSDLFSHSRVLAECGESILQCKTRITECVTNICSQGVGKWILVVTHPFACQILMNSVLHKGHSLLTEFWQQKGSFALFDFEQGNYGIKWKFNSGFNPFADSSYSTEEIYSRLLGKKRAPAPSSA